MDVLMMKWLSLVIQNRPFAQQFIVSFFNIYNHTFAMIT